MMVLRFAEHGFRKGKIAESEQLQGEGRFKERADSGRGRIQGEDGFNERADSRRGRIQGEGFCLDEHHTLFQVPCLLVQQQVARHEVIEAARNVCVTAGGNSWRDLLGRVHADRKLLILLVLDTQREPELSTRCGSLPGGRGDVEADRNLGAPPCKRLNSNPAGKGPDLEGIRASSGVLLRREALDLPRQRRSPFPGNGSHHTCDGELTDYTTSMII